MKALKLIVASTVLTLNSISVSVADTNSRWCDQPLPHMPVMDNIISIERSGDEFTIIRQFSGSHLKEVAQELSEGRYVVESGDGFWILPASGDIELFDDEGMIRTAHRMGSSAANDTCLRSG